DLPRWAIVFENNATRLFRRFTDVHIPGLKIELKSIQQLSSTVSKQLAEDIITNIDDKLGRLKGLRLVFERAELKITEAALREGIKDALRADKKLAGHPMLEQILNEVMKNIVIWP